jgi:hypothetical protein
MRVRLSLSSLWTARACLAGLLLVLVVPACGRRPSRSAPAEQAGPPGALSFIADDLPAALAEAKGRGVPVFVEAWAPW